MSELRKAAQQALEHLAAWSVGESSSATEVNDLIARLDAAFAQPERKPLTEEEIYKLFGWYAVPFVRAVEKAHGIGGEHE